MKKKALVLEGGGIRSAYLSGVLLAFHQKKLTGFDYVLGTSAGACCGANFIAGEPEKNRRILEDYLTGRRFVRFGNLFSKENIVDIDYLVDEVCKNHVPLNIEKIRKAAPTLMVTATHYQHGGAVYFNSREHDIHEILRASCAMPYLYRKQACYRGERFIDGGMVDSIPVKKAINLGATDIIVVGTREEGYRKSPDLLPNWVHRLFYPDSPQMPQVFELRSKRYNQAIDLICNPPQGVKIHFLRPSQKLSVSKTTRSKKRVHEAVELGFKDGMKFTSEKGAASFVSQISP
ncbi:MAG: hypothetical protein A3G32_02870 [Deltaproteobacteria bacterium RIFCSPLOWO2_12_FULL_40_28]|nr:MAG: hypothetical protein A3C45_00250 [Deltaproteobacteria bacterium RIFCSPHIGHO2_02_FULL_40_28]OGQ20058.1 MAG: hypothetical protein A3E27_02915 [Deltaproteobacteria bacterium RIFCSPHIGHO2_12_FULL_40_32]OGQ40625.1 MAG: hypothetical protein A3I69_10340 [Deltaproteobacteria bacterium RIFCSPLOWO2_02_FULL_40_36]OGQ54294.1 MAG: hypothetical protein A3G32_02870 [Deltaproteobacteria bacterium RIFCSPLOWO2_12_FULL_40_28]